MRILPSLPLLAALSLLATGCGAPNLTLRTYSPGEIVVPRARELALVEARGDQDAVTDFYRTLASNAAKGGYYTVKDRSLEGMDLVVEGDQVSLEKDGALIGLGEKEAGFRFDVTEYKVREGLVSTFMRGLQDGVIASTAFTVSMVQNDGTPILISVPLEGTCDDTFNDEGEVLSDGYLLRCASEKAAEELLKRITPTHFEQSFPMQGNGREVDRIFAAVRAREMEEALVLAEAYLAKNPEQHSAIFNVALLRDVLGDHEIAFDLYKQAIELAPKTQPYYRTALFGCEQRILSRKALSQGGPPVIGALK